MYDTVNYYKLPTLNIKIYDLIYIMSVCTHNAGFMGLPLMPYEKL